MSNIFSAKQELLEEKNALVVELKEAISNIDKTDCLTILNVFYIYGVPNSQQEVLYISKFEYICLMLDKYGSNSPKRPFIELIPLCISIVDMVERLFLLEQFTIFDFHSRSKEEANDPKEFTRVLLNTKAVLERAIPDSKHILMDLVGCFSPFKSDFKNRFGCEPLECVLVFLAVSEAIQIQLAETENEYEKHYEEILKLIKRSRKKPDSLPQELKFLSVLKPNRAKSQAKIIARLFSIENTEKNHFFTANEIADISPLDEMTVKSIFEVFSHNTDNFIAKHHEFPPRTNPISKTPIIKMENDCYFVGNFISFLFSVRPIFENKIETELDTKKSEDKLLKDKYYKNKGDYLEKESVRLLASLSSSNNSWQGVQWEFNGVPTDTDGIVSFDDVCFRISAKSGKFSDAARRGAPDRLLSTLKEHFVDASKQLFELEQTVNSQKIHSVGFSELQIKALERLVQINVITFMEDLDVWSSNPAELRKSDLVPETLRPTFVVSLENLRVMIDLLPPSDFLHYILTRETNKYSNSLMPLDEKNLLSAYLNCDLDFSKVGAEHVPDSIGLDLAENIDGWYAGTHEKPIHEIRKEVAFVLRQLEDQKPNHWVIASLALLEINRQTDDSIGKGISHIANETLKKGWANYSTIHNDLGFTFYSVLTDSPFELHNMTYNYTQNKSDEMQISNWITIGISQYGATSVHLKITNPESLFELLPVLSLYNLNLFISK